MSAPKVSIGGDITQIICTHNDTFAQMSSILFYIFIFPSNGLFTVSKCHCNCNITNKMVIIAFYESIHVEHFNKSTKTIASSSAIATAHCERALRVLWLKWTNVSKLIYDNVSTTYQLKSCDVFFPPQLVAYRRNCRKTVVRVHYNMDQTVH